MAKILVIDDCAEFREAVNDLLCEEGYDVELAENSEAAMSLFEQKEFDLVVCDLALPLEGGDAEEGIEDDGCAMVGVHTIYSLSKKYPAMPIIAVSGQLTGKPLEAISKFGAVRCISKPFASEVFLKAVQEELEKRSG